jgi:hypothetical protein
MNLGDISVFVGPDGSKHVGVVTEVNSDASVDICILKTSQRGVKLSPGSEPGTFFDPTMPADEPAAPVVEEVPPPVLSSVPEEVPNVGENFAANPQDTGDHGPTNG